MANKQLVSQYDGTMVKVGKQFRRVDKGAAVPDGADEEHVAVLLERGMVAEGRPVAGFVEPSMPEPPFSVDDVDDDGDGPDDVDGDGPIPPKSASRTDWDAYAKTQGLSDDEIAAFSTKEALQQHFGVE